MKLPLACSLFLLGNYQAEAGPGAVRRTSTGTTPTARSNYYAVHDRRGRDDVGDGRIGGDGAWGWIGYCALAAMTVGGIAALMSTGGDGGDDVNLDDLSPEEVEAALDAELAAWPAQRASNHRAITENQLAVEMATVGQMIEDSEDLIRLNEEEIAQLKDLEANMAAAHAPDSWAKNCATEEKTVNDYVANRR